MFESVPWRLVSLAGNFAVQCLRPDDVMVGLSQMVYKYALECFLQCEIPKCIIFSQLLSCVRSSICIYWLSECFTPVNIMVYCMKHNRNLMKTNAERKLVSVRLVTVSCSLLHNFIVQQICLGNCQFMLANNRQTNSASIDRWQHN